MQHFDTWPDQYDRWFDTPIGKLVKKVESNMLHDLIRPEAGDAILDAGCGTGIFTRDLINAGASIIGLEISWSMLRGASNQLPPTRFNAVLGNMLALPFRDSVFDKTVSITAIEFIIAAQQAIAELFRVTKPGGVVVVATLNRLSPWAERRQAAGQQGHPIFKHSHFRSPTEVADLSPVSGIFKTCVHFEKHTDPSQVLAIEKKGRAAGLDTGAFLVFRWKKPTL